MNWFEIEQLAFDRQREMVQEADRRRLMREVERPDAGKKRALPLTRVCALLRLEAHWCGLPV